VPDLSWTDDDQLFGMMGEAVRTARAVPPEFIAIGKAVFVPPDLDAELARLVYDSAREPALTRTETAALRALTFTARSLTIELEVTETGLIGQVVPPAELSVEVHTHDDPPRTVRSDEYGCFTVPQLPAGPLRLRCRDDRGLDVVTVWVNPTLP
jgi:hypothetical protein